MIFLTTFSQNVSDFGTFQQVLPVLGFFSNGLVFLLSCFKIFILFLRVSCFLSVISLISYNFCNLSTNGRFYLLLSPFYQTLFISFSSTFTKKSTFSTLNFYNPHYPYHNFQTSPTHTCHDGCIHSIPPMLRGHTPFLSASLKLYDEMLISPSSSSRATSSPNAFGGNTAEVRGSVYSFVLVGMGCPVT